MKLFLFALVYSTLLNFASAQAPTLDINGASAGGYGQVKFNNAAAIGQKSNDKLDYSEVRGKYFWQEEWNPAILILNAGKSYKVRKAKLNFYTSDVIYIDNNLSELAAQTGLVKKIVFFSTSDTARVIGAFIQLARKSADGKEHFYQLLNDGKIQLLKSTTVTLRKGTYDPMVGKDQYSFNSTYDYFISNSGIISPLKSISKSSIISTLNLDDSDNKWLTSNKNKLKNETDVVSFLNYLNNQK